MLENNGAAEHLKPEPWGDRFPGYTDWVLDRGAPIHRVKGSEQPLPLGERSNVRADREDIKRTGRAKLPRGARPGVARYNHNRASPLGFEIPTSSSHRPAGMRGPNPRAQYQGSPISGRYAQAINGWRRPPCWRTMEQRSISSQSHGATDSPATPIRS